MKKILISVLLIICCVSGCAQIDNEQNDWKQDISIPNADIVYNTIIKSTNDNSTKDVLGFYSFEFKSSRIIDLGDGFHPTHPMYIGENSLVILEKMGNFGSTNETMSYILSFDQQHYQKCRKFIGTEVYPYKGKIVFDSEYGIYLVDYEECSVIKEIISNSEISNLIGSEKINSYSISDDGSFLVLSVNYSLYLINLESKQITDYRKEGIYARISPDGNKIVFLSLDGIHIMGFDGGDDQLVVPYISSEGSFGTFFRGNPPKPDWSSDGKRIIYHKCTLPNNLSCSGITDYSIFIYDLENNSESFLLQGGLNPSWNDFIDS